MFLCFKLAPIVCSALIHSTLLSSWLLEQVWNKKTHNLFIFSTEKIPKFWTTKWSKERTWLHSFAYLGNYSGVRLFFLIHFFHLYELIKPCTFVTFWLWVIFKRTLQFWFFWKMGPVRFKYLGHQSTSLSNR